ncbi:hypothetical protein E2542_SST05723 [Spatholobus suberectus]|nr:hypothetical protein E2542_SST05723 [Spatholobus suberectus]
MYVTRPLSLYKNCADALSLPPPEGPNSGILVIQDEDLEPTSCFGLGESHEVEELPFPQNLNLELFYRSGISLNRTTHYHHVAFIPVLNQPLSSNKYYVIQLNGKKRGEAYINSKEEDLDTCCFYNAVSDVPLHPIDISDTHQVFEIYPRRSKVTFRGGFSAKSVAPDGYPPRFLSRRWKVSASTSSDSTLGKASGVNEALRASKPEFKFSLAKKSSESVAVGKWYCPFMFIKEGTHRTLKEEMRKSMFYEMTLEQKWEQIFSCKNEHGMGNTVNVDAVVQKEVVVIAGWEAEVDEANTAEGFLWFNSFNNVGEKSSVGLSTAVVERMKWEQERVGWNGGKEKQVRVKKVEEFEGTNGWNKFGCYVMYVTRPFSLYKKSADALSLPPPEGPNSGILVIQDEDLEPTSCFGLGESHEVEELPFPQNLNLELFYRSGISLNRTTHNHHVAFIPVLNQPLSSNKYYVIQLNGKKRGEAYINSKEEDLDTVYNAVSDVPLHPIDISDTHQEFEIYPRRSKVTFRGGFSAKSVAPDGNPPRFLSRRWKVSASTSSDSTLGEASGVNEALRASKPEFKFSLAKKSSESVAVGKWYCPFMFIKEGTHRTLKEEMRKSMFYEMTLEQKWEQIFSCENEHGMGNTVNVDAVVQKEVVVIAGWEAEVDEANTAEGFLWFNSFNNVGEKSSVGLSIAVVERMKWEQERVGWNGGKGKQVRVKKVEEFEGTNGWNKFGCYVLVETFVLKRLDGSIVLTYTFKHHDQLRSKWE